MNGSLDARIEVARGELTIGALVVPMTPEGAAGEWRVGGAAGPLLRPLRYGERTRLSGFSAGSAEPQASLAAAVARASTVADGVVDDTVREVAALLLSGARDTGMPFSDVLLRVGRAGGWDLSQMLDAPADEVDRLARAISGVDPQSTRPLSADTSGDGWNRLVFDDGRGQATLAAIRDMLADNLLARVDGTGASELPVNVAADTSVPRAQPSEPEAAPDVEPGALVSSRWFMPASQRRRTPLADADQVRQPVGPPSGSESESHSWALSQPRVPTSAVVDAVRLKADPTTDATGSRQSLKAVQARVSAHSSVQDQSPVADLSRTPPHSWVPASAGAARVAPLAFASGTSVRRITSRPDRLGLGAVSGAASAIRVSSPWTPGTLRASHPTRPAAPAPSPQSIDELTPDLADALATLLQEEADLRGLE